MSSSWEMKVRPVRFSARDRAAASPRPGMAEKGGRRLFFSSFIRNLVASDS